jgi:hypothetical protein
MQRYIVYLETALYVSGGTSTHHQERKQLHLQHLVFVRPLLPLSGRLQPPTEMSTRNISWGGIKGGRCVGLTILPPSCVDCLEIWEPQPPGTLWACLGL